MTVQASTVEQARSVLQEIVDGVFSSHDQIFKGVMDRNRGRLKEAQLGLETIRKEIVFSDAQISEWKLATTEGQDIVELKGEEIFGYPVESGMGCFMDVETQDRLNHLEKRLFYRKGAEFMGIYEEFFHEHFFDENGAIDQFAFLQPDDENSDEDGLEIEPDDSDDELSEDDLDAAAIADMENDNDE